MTDTTTTPQITITKSQLEAAVRAMERDLRAGRGRSRNEIAAMPEALVAMEGADRLWRDLAAATGAGQ